MNAIPNTFSLKNTRRSPFNLLFLIDPYLAINPVEEPTDSGIQKDNVNDLQGNIIHDVNRESMHNKETLSTSFIQPPPPSLSKISPNQNLEATTQFIPLLRQFLEHFLTYLHSHYYHLLQCAFHLISAPTVKPPSLCSFSSTFIQSCCYITGKALRRAEPCNVKEWAECLYWLSNTVLNPAVTLSQSTLVSPARPVREKLQSSILVRHSIFIISSQLPTLAFLNEMQHQYQLNAPLLASNLVLHWIHLPLFSEVASIREVQYMNAFGGICASLPLDYRLPFSLIFSPFLQRQLSSPQVMECLQQPPSGSSLLYPTYENNINLELDDLHFAGVPLTPFSFSKGPWKVFSETGLDSSVLLTLPSYEVQHSVLLDDPMHILFSSDPTFSSSSSSLSTSSPAVGIRLYQNVSTHQQALCFPISGSRLLFHILSFPLCVHTHHAISSPMASSSTSIPISSTNSIPTVHTIEPFFPPSSPEPVPSIASPPPIELQLEFLNPSMPTTPCLPSTPHSTSPYVNLMDLILELTYTSTPPFPHFYRRLPDLRPQFPPFLNSLLYTNAQLSEKFKTQLPQYLKNTGSTTCPSQEQRYLDAHVGDLVDEQRTWLMQSWIRACCLQLVFYFEDLLIRQEQEEHHATQLQFLLSRLDLLCSEHQEKLLLDTHWQVDVKSWFEQVVVYHYYASFPSLVHDLYVQLGGELESYKAHTVHPFSPAPTRTKVRLPSTPSFHRPIPPSRARSNNAAPTSTRKSRLMQRLRGAREIVIKDQGAAKRDLDDAFTVMDLKKNNERRKKERTWNPPSRTGTTNLDNEKDEGKEHGEHALPKRRKKDDEEEEADEEEQFWTAESPTKQIAKKKEMKKALFGALVFGARLRGQPPLEVAGPPSNDLETDSLHPGTEPWLVRTSTRTSQDRFQSLLAKYSTGLSLTSEFSKQGN